jgi:terminase small subunit / prophage DNA-packing protein
LVSAEETLSASELAYEFDCDEKTIRNLMTRGIVVKSSRGRYARSESTRNYVRHLREVASGRGGGEKQATLAEEKSRLARAQADHASLKIQILKGEMVEVSVVERTWAAILSAVRARVLAIVSDITQMLPHLTRHDVDTIDRALRDALNDAADDIGAN